MYYAWTEKNEYKKKLYPSNDFLNNFSPSDVSV